jgi:hypothetical protein
MNEHEAERIAAAMHHLRPDWPAASLRTLINKNLINRPRRDVAVALAWVACEAATATPARVLEAGPWWKAAGIEGTTAHRDNPSREDRCHATGLSLDRCRQVWGGDHEHRMDVRPELAPVDVAARVQELKQHMACEEPRTTPAREHKPSAAVDALREQLPDPTPTEANR